MADKYIVYIHRNMVNQKVYVGMTSRRAKQRWKRGNGYKLQPEFYREIEEYGWDNFEHIVIAENLTKEQAGALERELINEFDSADSAYGYNIALGGEGTESISDEMRTRYSRAQKRRYSDDTIREQQRLILAKYCHSSEADAKRAATLKKKYEDPNERKKISDAVKQYYIDHPEISASLTARNNKRYEDPTEREKTGEVMKRRWSDPSERQKLSAAIKNYYSTPEGKAKKSAAMKRRWSDPAERAKQSERIRAAKAKRKQQAMTGTQVVGIN